MEFTDNFVLENFKACLVVQLTAQKSYSFEQELPAVLH